MNTFDTNGMGRLMTKNVTKVSGGANMYAMTGPSGGNMSYASNGMLLGVTDGGVPAVTNTYDDWNRLANSTQATTPTSTAFTWDYDRYGNRFDQKVNGFVTVNPGADANNRETAITRDAMGNITYDSVAYYTYDGENRLVKVGSSGGASDIAAYKYDAFNRRVEKWTASDTLDFMFDLDGHTV